MLASEIIAFDHRVRSAGFCAVEVLMSREVYVVLEKEIGQPVGGSLQFINGLPIKIQDREGWAIAVKKW